MNFSNLKEWTTPRGNVVELAIDGKIAWKKVTSVPISTLPVGSSVFMNVDGVSTEFLVVHQGLPDATMYDSSCRGTWLLMKDIYIKIAFSSGYSTVYNGSTIYHYMYQTFEPKLDQNIRNIIKNVKIPYVYSEASDEPKYGSNGLSVKTFILSYSEVGFDVNNTYDEEWDRYNAYAEGVTLDYFKDTNVRNKRKALFNGSACGWWLRTPCMHYEGDDDWYVTTTGYESYITNSYQDLGLRPALILPSNTLVDGDFNVVA